MRTQARTVRPRPPANDRPAHVAFIDELARQEHGGWAILQRPPRLKLPTGQVYSLTKIGKGAFTTAYEVADLGAVIAEVHDVNVKGSGPMQVDFSKSILSELASDNPHLPHVRFLGSTRDAQLFGMPKYKVPLRKTDSLVAWAQSRTLAACTERALQTRRSGERGHEIRQQAVECMAGTGLDARAPLLLDAVETLSDYANNYGDDFFFEFPPRNLGTDEAGNLILLDVLFDREALSMRRKNPAPPSLLGWFESALRPNGGQKNTRRPSAQKKIVGVRRKKIIAAIQEARRRRDLGDGSVWSNLVLLLGEKEAEVAMMNLMWADPGFAPSPSRRNAQPRRYGIRTTYDLVTPESAEDGDTAETGFIGSGGHRYPSDHLHGPSKELTEIMEDSTIWYDEERCDRCPTGGGCSTCAVKGVVGFLRFAGASMESTSGMPTVHDWYSTTRDDPYSGESETEHYHLVGDWTLDDAHAISDALTRPRPNGLRRNGMTAANVKSQIGDFMDREEMFELRDGEVTWHHNFIPNLPDVGPIHDLFALADYEYRFEAFPRHGGYKLVFVGAVDVFGAGQL